VKKLFRKLDEEAFAVFTFSFERLFPTFSEEKSHMKSLGEYEPYLSQVMKFIAHDTRFRCRPNLAGILVENPRLVVAISHSTPLSWLPAIALLTERTCAKGGGDRVPVGVLDRFFFRVPLLRELAKYLSQSDRPLTFSEFIDHFENLNGADIVLFPEGSNCFFGEPEDIQEFRSSRFVELAVRVNAPILIAVHRGSEDWAKALPVPSAFLDKLNLLPGFAVDFLEKRLRQSGVLVLPFFPKPMAKFEMLCELYHPALKKADLSEDKSILQTQIQAEGEKVRQRMKEMLAEIDSPAEMTPQSAP
jgi:hypothetical protein